MDSSPFWKYLIICFLLLIVVILLGLFSLPDGNLHVVACDVGEGDAILITRGSNQILIDGGPDNSVLNCLGSYMPFYDRTLEMVILTHPESDHYTGLVEVFRRYNVNLFLKNNITSDSQGVRVLDNLVGSRGIKVLTPSIGQRLRLGLIYLDILWPNECKNNSLNDCAIVTKLTYGDFKAIFTGDLEGNKKWELMATGLLGPVDYIKISHHGSKNGITNYLLSDLRPEVAVISVGKDNRYGHPAEETLDQLKNYGVKVLRTDELGDVEIISDGKRYWIK